MNDPNALELPYGKINGRFIVEIQDGPDPNEAPDLIAAKGTITLKADVDYLQVIGSDIGDFTMWKGPFKAELDEEGYLSTINPETGKIMYRGMSLLSNDSPLMSVNGWTWTATFNLTTPIGKSISIPPTSFTLGTGEDKDLTTLIRVPATSGYGLPQAEASALRAEEAALKAQEFSEIALDIKRMADEGLFDGRPGDAGEDGAPGNATLRVDTSVGKRVFISDGTTEHMISGDIGWRNISSSVPGYLSGALLIKRENNTTWLRFDNLQAEDQSTTWSIWSGVIPSGFRFSEIGYDYQPLAPQSSSYATGPMRTDRFGGITVYLVQGEKTMQGTVSWITGEPWPTTLPGTPA